MSQRMTARPAEIHQRTWISHKQKNLLVSVFFLDVVFTILLRHGFAGGRARRLEQFRHHRKREPRRGRGSRRVGRGSAGFRRCRRARRNLPVFPAKAFCAGGSVPAEQKRIGKIPRLLHDNNTRPAPSGKRRSKNSKN